MSGAELSVVIPVYNGSETIVAVVEEVQSALAGLSHEIVLVNDGSSDASEAVCNRLAARYPETVTFVQLSRNFGEHAAVLAGLRRTRGRYVATMDDDGQNPPDQILLLLDYARAHDLDVVYGRYREKRHSRLRNWGSWFTNAVATVVLKKPPELYLSSFRVMSRFLVKAVTRYRGPYPYLDGLILQATQRIGQIEVEHRQRQGGRSGYNLRRLVRLWSNMFLGFSIAPLRLATLGGMAVSLLSFVLLVAIVVDKLFFSPNVTVGIPTVLVCLTFFAGVQLWVLGMVGEYVGRVFLQLHGKPQAVVRYERLVGGNKPVRRPRRHAC
ncbi:MAG: glycosyltransferase family 2 protein [Thermoguttaceae bacterium]|jgi:glycosyltransferase involved in cell wall biosynthesis